MTTTIKQYTHEEVRAAFNAALARLLPAVLKNTPEDQAFIERLVTQQMLAKSLEPTAENFYSVFNTEAIFTVLPWAVKPAKLVLMEKSAAPAKLESNVKLNADRTKIVKGAELAAAYEKEQSAFEQSCYELIDSFLPMTVRGQRIDYRKQTETQVRLKNHVAAEKTRGCRMRDVHAVVAKAIQDEYTLIERASERV